MAGIEGIKQPESWGNVGGTYGSPSSSSGGGILSGGLGLLGASNPWIAGASMIMSALSGTEINTSSAQAMATSGLGAFGAENTGKISAAAIDLTDPLTLGIACTVVVLGAYILKKRFR